MQTTNLTPSPPFSNPGARWLAPPRRRLLRLSAGLAALASPLIGSPLAGAARAEAGGIVRVAGNGGAMGAMRQLASAHADRTPGAEMRFVPNLGSSGGIAALLAGVVDLAVAARSTNERERIAGAVCTAYARTPICFATHPGVADITSLTPDDAARILSGDQSQWPDGSPIRPVRRPHNDAMTLALSAASPTMQRAMERLQRRPGITTAGNDQDNAEALESVRGAFGAITLAQHLTERRRLRLLTLDAVEPTAAALAEGRYPLAITLYAVVRADASPATVAFQEFLLGADGAAGLRATGHDVPTPAGRAS
ncbi:MAG: substrate-binding domain-containing protein [Acetobacteraceae bacterium]|nr:substrate-binding domain-containing protein [Acetobacteraceae bacterium]